jgi:uncharacterized protein
MSTTTVRKQQRKATKATIAAGVPAGLPDLPWYRDAANRKKRLAHIQILCDQIAREFHPDKIILFGSQAYGKPTVESDVDLLVVMPYEGSPFRQAGEILKRVIPRVGVLPLDLLVRTPEQINERLAMGDGFMGEILERGKVMYEANNR